MTTTNALPANDSPIFSHGQSLVCCQMDLRYLHGTVDHDMLIHHMSGTQLQAFTNSYRRVPLLHLFLLHSLTSIRLVARMTVGPQDALLYILVQT